MTEINAAEYGKALFLVAEERGTSERVMEECTAVCKALAENPKYPSLLDTPALAKDEKCKLVDEAFGTLDADHLNFLKILTEARAVYLYPKCAAAFRSEYYASRGITEVEAVSAKPLSAEQSERLISALEGKLGGKVLLRNTVDASLLGGMKLRYAGIQVDGTLKSRLDAIEKKLFSVIVD